MTVPCHPQLTYHSQKRKKQRKIYVIIITTRAVMFQGNIYDKWLVDHVFSFDSFITQAFYSRLLSGCSKCFINANTYPYMKINI